MPELDPDARAVVEMIEDRPFPPRFALTVESSRDALREVFVSDEPYAEVGGVTEFTIPGPDDGSTDQRDGIPVRLYDPGSDPPHPTLVFFHGGGWVAGDLDTHDNVCRALCARADCAVLSVDYRLAPEHPFPAGLTDAYATLEWVAAHGEATALDTDRLAVGGDSAGGNLATAAALMARDFDGPDLVHQLLVYPVVASPEVHSFSSYEENGEGYLLEMPGVEWYYERYVPSRAHARNPYFAPLLANDHAGLAPASVLTAGFDPLRDEGQAYADRLEEADVPVERHHYDGQIHAFVSLTEFVDAADEALDALAADLRASFRK